MKNYKDKYGPWALITGASSGIGEEFARKLASLKFNLFLIARRKNLLENLAAELESEFSIKAIVICVDLSDDNFLEEIKNKTAGNEIGLLINNAGLGSVGEFAVLNPDDEIKMIKVNCLAPAILTHHFINKMLERKKGGIIFLGSLLSFQPTPFSASYSATKAFNSFLGDALWYEMKKHNIDVLSLNPGGTDTGFIRLSGKFNNSSLIRTTENVVETALKAIGRKPSVIDGLINKILVFGGRLLPRKTLINLSGLISGKLHEHRENNK